MAERNFPQIPKTVWWGVRELLKNSPNITVTDTLLAASLKVQPAAAKQYVLELKRTAMLDDEGRATSIAKKWRLDGEYSDAVKEIVAANYPEELVALAPPDNLDRETVKTWFMGQGLGQGAAGNKTATYVLISSPDPGEASAKPAGQKSTPKAKSPSESKRPAKKDEERNVDVTRSKTLDIPLNVNVQIHISADASSEQIETIFSAMRKHLYDQTSG